MLFTNCNYLPDVIFLFFSFSLNDALAFLWTLKSSLDKDDHDLAKLHPIEKANAETDMESDVSDGMNNGLVHHLPRRLLNSPCVSSLPDKGNKEKSVQRSQVWNKKSRKLVARTSKKGTDLQPTLKLSKSSAVPEEWKEIFKSTLDMFEAMFSDELVLHVTNQTNLFAVQYGKGNLNILEDEIRTFIAVWSFSRHCKVPYRNLYWIDAPDTHNKAVSCAINGKKFREILSNLHLADYRLQKLDTTKYEYYFKSWISISNSMVQFVNHSVDESNIPY